MTFDQLAAKGRGWIRHSELVLEGWVAWAAPMSRAFAARRCHELSVSWDRQNRRLSLAEQVGTGIVKYSQNDEDSILVGLFEQIGETNRFFVEIGASDGSENCTRYLAEMDWNGVWLEADPKAAQDARSVAPPSVNVFAAGVTPRNVVAVLSQAGVPTSPDLLVLDIDGNDWWVLRSLLRSFSPRVIVAEYNGTFRPGQWWTMRYRGNRGWDRTFRHGASLHAINDLLERSRYALIGCDSKGVNAFFVQAAIVPGALAARVGTAADHYTAPSFSPFPHGHPRSRRVFRPMLALTHEELSRIEVLDGIRLGPGGPVSVGSPICIQACIRNDTDVTLTSGAPAAVNVNVRYFDSDGAACAEPAIPRTALPCPVRPHHTVVATAWAPAPKIPGRYHIEMTLVQEWVAWLPEVQGPHRSISLPIEVIAD